jgi:hypothetical protein
MGSDGLSGVGISPPKPSSLLPSSANNPLPPRFARKQATQAIHSPFKWMAASPRTRADKVQYANLRHTVSRRDNFVLVIVLLLVIDRSDQEHDYEQEHEDSGLRLPRCDLLGLGG